MPPEQNTTRHLHHDASVEGDHRILSPSADSDRVGTNAELESSSCTILRSSNETTDHSNVTEVGAGPSSEPSETPDTTGAPSHTGQLLHADADELWNHLQNHELLMTADNDQNAWPSENITTTTFHNNNNHSEDDIWSAAYDEEECKREISEEFPLTFHDPWEMSMEQTRPNDRTFACSDEIGDRRVAVMAQQEEYDAQFAEYLAEEEDRLLALKLSEAYGDGHGRNGDDEDATAEAVVHANQTYDVAAVPSTEVQQQQEGTVVEIQQIVERVISTEYVPQNDEETIHAQWIGHEYSNLIPASSQINTDVPQNTVPEIAPTIAAVVHQDDSAQEATVIDSAPIEKEQHIFTEEAQVLPEQHEAPSLLDRKPPSSRNSPRRSRRRRERNVEAEITSMQETEDIHPLERTDDGAQAELVGTVDSYTVAVPPISQTTAAAAESVEIAPTEGANSTSLPTAVTPEAQAIVTTARNESGEEDEVAIASAIMDVRVHPQGEHDTEQAEVFLDREVESEMDQKPAAVNRLNYYATINENQSFNPATVPSTQAEIIESRHGVEVCPSGDDVVDHANDSGVDSARCEQLTRSLDHQEQHVLEVVDAVQASLDAATQVNSLETNSESTEIASPDVMVASVGNSVELTCEQQSAAVLKAQQFEHANGQFCVDTQCSSAEVAEEATHQAVVAHAINVNSASIVPLLRQGAIDAFHEQADIVDIQHLEDLHPLVREETISTSSMAELVGTTEASQLQTAAHAQAVVEAISDQALRTGLGSDVLNTRLHHCGEALSALDDLSGEDRRDFLDLEVREDPRNAIIAALQQPERTVSPFDDEHSAEWLHVQLPDQTGNNPCGNGHCNTSSADSMGSPTTRTLKRTASSNFHMVRDF
jgi:hypothetical protein